MAVFGFLPRRESNVITRAEWIEQRPTHLYEVLDSYYHANSLYEDVQAAHWERGIWTPGMRGVRNPANRTVEFYASKLWPGTLASPGEELPPGETDALPILTDNPNLTNAVRQVWEWSNWGSQKQVAARWLAIHGDLFIKVVGRQSLGQQRVYFQLLRANHVSDFDVDERGYITWIRIDVPQTVRANDGGTREMTYTEVWDKAGNSYRQWLHDKGSESDLDRLGAPDVDESMTARFGIDFVPIVHAKHRDIGQLRGQGAFTHALDKIDEANRQATRLHQMLFRNNTSTWVLKANGNDQQGRPLPPPRLRDAQGNAMTAAIEIGEDTFYALPGNADLTSLVPSLDYDAALRILQDMMLEIEKDLPEMAYFRLREMNQVSGVAVRTLLSDAIDRLLEARGNAEAALIRADQMAITIGAAMRIPILSGVGVFESGDLAHRFAPRDVISLTVTEQAQTEMMEVQTLTLKRELGVTTAQVLEELGYEDDQIAGMLAEADAQAARNAERQAALFDRGLGGFPGEEQ